MERPESLSFAAPSPGVQNTNQAVTPDNPIPARVRDVSPAWPSQFLGEPFNVAVSVKVALDGDGGVIDVVGAECVVSETPSTATRDAVCHAFFDAAAAAVRQWRYERPVRVPLQFFVIVSFRKGSDPAIMQSLRSLPIEATPTFGEKLL